MKDEFTCLGNEFNGFPDKVCIGDYWKDGSRIYRVANVEHNRSYILVIPDEPISYDTFEINHGTTKRFEESFMYHTTLGYAYTLVKKFFGSSNIDYVTLLRTNDIFWKYAYPLFRENPDLVTSKMPYWVVDPACSVKEKQGTSVDFNTDHTGGELVDVDRDTRLGIRPKILIHDPNMKRTELLSTESDCIFNETEKEKIKEAMNRLSVANSRFAIRTVISILNGIV